MADGVATASQGETAPPAQRIALNERLDQIRSQPKLQSQQQTAVVLSAVEDTLRDQKSEFTPTAYFAALLSLLHQYVSSTAGIVNKDVAAAVVYLLDLVTAHVPNPILRSKFGQILQSLAPALSHPQAEAPFLRSSIGCLVSLLVAQDSQAWALPQTQIGPRKAVAGLLSLALDHRPKVRKRAQDGLATVLATAVPGPSLDHPAADMSAETALRSFEQIATASGHIKKTNIKREAYHHEPELIHAMQLIKVIAGACKGWPSKNLESLCEVLFAVARSKSNFLTMTAFEVFEAIFEGLADDESSSKFPRLLEATFELKPSINDTQLVPPWIAIISRAYDVSSQIEPDETFQKLPSVFETIAAFFASPAHNIRVSAAECLVSFLVNCIPPNVILEPSIYDEKVIEKLGATVDELMSVKYQSAWMEVFTVVGAMFDHLLWQSWPVMTRTLVTVDGLRTSEAFAGKKEADQIVSKAIRAAGPENILKVLPLNLGTPQPGVQGRAWLIPLLRDSVSNTNLMHFRIEMVPLSEKLYQRVMDHGNKEKTPTVKVFETLIQQVWACLPGYCDRPLDVRDAFDQAFAEQISQLLYQQPDMRDILCRSLQTLADSFKTIVSLEGEEEDLILQGRITKEEAQKVLEYLSSFSSNLLAVLFNVYTETLPQKRGPVLSCIDSYLSITTPKELSDTFDRVATMLDTQLKEAASTAAEKSKSKADPKAAPPVSHALMDLIVAIAIYLPRESFQALFNIAATTISQKQEPQLQKKAYKLIPRLSQSEAGKAALVERSSELQQMLLQSAETTLAPARKDRLSALAVIISALSPTDLYFIPCILPEVILCTKETNEKARLTAFDLLIQMGDKMQAGGTIDNSKVKHMASDATSVPASIEEYFTMLSAGLAGSTPHMISASVQAIARVLFQFRTALPEPAIIDAVETMDLFLKSPTREVVRSVLGFIKVCVITLPSSIMSPRLPTLIPGLLAWSHEHKAHFRVKVKSIIERMIRHYGFDIVERHTPVDDKKLVNHIRKTRERSRRKKKGGAADDNTSIADDDAPAPAKFGNEFDEAIYGSDDDETDSDADDMDVQMRDSTKSKSKPATNQRQKPSKRGESTFIHEDSDEPLDLLDRKSLAHISSTKPGAARSTKRHKATYDLDGKLLLGGKSKNNTSAPHDEDDEMLDADSTSLEAGINAYVDAIRGADAPTRGRGGRLKFSQKKRRDDVEMEDGDDDDAPRQKKSGKGEIARSPRRGGSGGGGGGVGRDRYRGGGSGRGGGARERGFAGRGGGGGGRVGAMKVGKRPGRR